MIVILLLRGPHTKLHTWFGYEGGMAWRKEVHKEKTEKQALSEAADVGKVVQPTSSSTDEKAASRESDGSMV